jgi:hypothetical protein
MKKKIQRNLKFLPKRSEQNLGMFGKYVQDGGGR